MQGLYLDFFYSFRNFVSSLGACNNSNQPNFWLKDLQQKVGLEFVELNYELEEVDED